MLIVEIGSKVAIHQTMAQFWNYEFKFFDQLQQVLQILFLYFSYLKFKKIQYS